MRSGRWRAALVGAVAACLALASCATGPSTSEATVRVWLVGGTTPQRAKDHLQRTFQEKHPGAKLVIEEQEWPGLVERMTESLSGKGGPDLVEAGNTQTPAFTSAGLFRELSDTQVEKLGGSDLLEAFVAGGDWEGKHYAVPYYASVRVVFVSASLGAQFQPPETLAAFVELAKSLTTVERSGTYWLDYDWYNALPFIWENGGYIAQQQDDGTWQAGFGTEGGIAGLTMVQDLMLHASDAEPTSTVSDLGSRFCQDRIAMLSVPTVFQSAVQADLSPEACPPGAASGMTAFALPGNAPGETATTLGAGSHLAISANSAHPDLALSAMEIMLSDAYQSILGANNIIPAKVSLGATVPQGNPVARAGKSAMRNTALTPVTPRWAEVEAQEILQQAFARLAGGESVTSVAAYLDSEIERILNS